MRTDDSPRLVLDPIDETSWRLCDRAVDSNDADNVLAYVEQRDDGRIDVTWLVRCLGTATFATVGDLLESAAELIDDTRSRNAKPTPIAHRPPRRAS